jgi:hypothetical protein
MVQSRYCVSAHGGGSISADQPASPGGSVNTRTIAIVALILVVIVVLFLVL